MQEPLSHLREQEAPIAPPPPADEARRTKFSLPFSFNRPIKWRGEEERPLKTDAAAYYAWLEKFAYDLEYILAFHTESGVPIPEVLAQKFYGKLLLGYAETYYEEADEGQDGGCTLSMVPVNSKILKP